MPPTLIDAENIRRVAHVSEISWPNGVIGRATVDGGPEQVGLHCSSSE